MDQSLAQALRESEELHRITLSNMSDAVFITDDEGAFTYICPNVDVIFGYGQAEVRTLHRIAGLLGRELVDRDLLHAEGELRNIEHEITTKDGARRCLLVHVKQVAIKGGTTLYVCRDISERKRSEVALRRSEQRLSLALEAASMGLWDWHVPTGQMTWSHETHRLLGDVSQTQTPSFAVFLDCLHPADRVRVSQAMADAMAEGGSYETEFRIRGFDGLERWVMSKGRALRNGKPLRMIGVLVDFTEHHRIEDDLRELSGRLINAHEQERIRVSRELHDGVAQRMVLLGAELELLRRDLPPASGDVGAQIARMTEQTREIGLELHRLSHELHPARLQQLGLEASVRSLCDEIAKTHALDLHADIHELSAPVAPEIALNVYRVAQEALQNVVKHSRAARATVRLSVVDGEVVLMVTDDGIGFDTAAVRSADTLGLVSMRERARLLGGDLRLTSQPGCGAQVTLRAQLHHA